MLVLGIVAYVTAREALENALGGKGKESRERNHTKEGSSHQGELRARVSGFCI